MMLRRILAALRRVSSFVGYAVSDGAGGWLDYQVSNGSGGWLIYNVAPTKNVIAWNPIDHPGFDHYVVVISAVEALTDPVYETTTTIASIPVPDIPGGTYYIGIKACDEIEEICGDWAVQKIEIGLEPAPVSICSAVQLMPENGVYLTTEDGRYLSMERRPFTLVAEDDVYLITEDNNYLGVC